MKKGRKREMTLKEAQMKGGNANTPAQKAARRANIAKANAKRAQMRLELDKDK